MLLVALVVVGSALNAFLCGREGCVMRTGTGWMEGKGEYVGGGAVIGKVGGGYSYSGYDDDYDGGYDNDYGYGYGYGEGKMEETQEEIDGGYVDVDEGDEGGYEEGYEDDGDGDDDLQDDEDNVDEEKEAIQINATDSWIENTNDVEQSDSIFDSANENEGEQEEDSGDVNLLLIDDAPDDAETDATILNEDEDDAPKLDWGDDVWQQDEEPEHTHVTTAEDGRMQEVVDEGGDGERMLGSMEMDAW